MTKIYQTIVDKRFGNCMQAAVASLFDMPLDNVPNFKLFGDEFWHKFIDFVSESGYEFHGTLYNAKLQVMEGYESFLPGHELDGRFPPADRFPNVKDMLGVDGYFIASVYSPKYFDALSDKRQVKHSVIINRDLEIIHPVNFEYNGMRTFPLHWLIDYNGILDVLMIERKKP